MNKLVYDIGGSHIKFAIMTPEGDILERRTADTPRDSFNSYFTALENLAERYQGQADGAAVSTNGRMFPDGETYRAYTMDFLTGVNLRTELEKRLGMPVVVENDGIAATVGEWWKGAAQGADSVLGIVLGSGMGAGIVVNGQPLRGTKNNSAMVFGMLSRSDMESGHYMASGLDTVFPVLLYKLAAVKNLELSAVTGHKFFEMAESGDPAARALLQSYCQAVAVTIFNAAMAIDPECVIVTGGLAQQSLLIEGIRRGLEDIAEKAFTYGGRDISKLGIQLEPEDFAIDLRPGKLCQDANLYGALYRLV